MDGVHDIDLVVWLVGPAEVRHASLMCSGTLGIEAVDCAALHLEHVSGARSELHVDYLRRIKLRGLEVTGRDGTIVWESVGKNPEHATVRLRTKNDQAVRLVFDNDDVDANAPYQAMLADLAAALDGRDHRLQSGADARSVAALVLPLLQHERMP